MDFFDFLFVESDFPHGLAFPVEIADDQLIAQGALAHPGFKPGFVTLGNASRAVPIGDPVDGHLHDLVVFCLILDGFRYADIAAQSRLGDRHVPHGHAGNGIGVFRMVDDFLADPGSRIQSEGQLHSLPWRTPCGLRP